jgi:hypothetical protein
VDDPEVDRKVSVPKFFGNEKIKYISDDLMSGLEAGPKTYFENTSIDEKNKVCIYTYVYIYIYDDVLYYGHVYIYIHMYI